MKEKGKISKSNWRIIYSRGDVNCNECGERLLLPPEYRTLKKIIGSRNNELMRALEYLRFSFGHVKPVALGGQDSLDNIVGEHFWCNKEKKTKTKLDSLQISWIRDYAARYVPRLLEYLPEDFSLN